MFKPTRSDTPPGNDGAALQIDRDDEQWPRRRRQLFAWLCFLLIVFTYDVAMLGPYLIDELRRLEPYKVLLIFIGDAAALLWATWFCFKHLVFNIPVQARPRKGRGRLGPIWAFNLSIAAAIALDAYITLYFRDQELREYAGATQTVAQVTAIEPGQKTDKFWRVVLRCEFLPAGRSEPVSVRLRLAIPTAPESPASAPAYMTSRDLFKLRTGVYRGDFPIRYAPGWPWRAWAEGFDVDELGFAETSLIILFLQAGTLIFLAFGATVPERGTRPRNAPWWVELREVVPFAVQTIVVAVPATMFRLVG